MNALALSSNPHDTLLAGLLIGAFLGSVGLGILLFGRSLWAERMAKKAERIFGFEGGEVREFDLSRHPVFVRDETTPELLRSFDQSVAIATQTLAEDRHFDAIARHAEDAQRRLAPVAPVLPLRKEVR